MGEQRGWSPLQVSSSSPWPRLQMWTRRGSMGTVASESRLHS